MMTMLAPGIELMLIGLGSVFAFLILLIGTIKCASAGARALDSRNPAPPAASPAAPATHTAAITTAIHHFRQQR